MPTSSRAGSGALADSSCQDPTLVPPVATRSHSFRHRGEELLPPRSVVSAARSRLPPGKPSRAPGFSTSLVQGNIGQHARQRAAGSRQRLYRRILHALQVALQVCRLPHETSGRRRPGRPGSRRIRPGDPALPSRVRERRPRDPNPRQIANDRNQELRRRFVASSRRREGGGSLRPRPRGESGGHRGERSPRALRDEEPAAEPPRDALPGRGRGRARSWQSRGREAAPPIGAARRPMRGRRAAGVRVP